MLTRGRERCGVAVMAQDLGGLLGTKRMKVRDLGGGIQT